MRAISKISPLCMAIRELFNMNALESAYKKMIYSLHAG